MAKENEDRLKDALATAIYREIGARDFYKRLSSEIENGEGRDRFKRLASDEESHRKKLEGWYEKLFGKRFAVSPESVAASEIKHVKIRKKAGAMEALDLAIKAEAEAEDFYARQGELISQAELKDLFLRLSKEEHGHYEILVAERNTLAGGFYWFDMDSTSFLED